MLCDGEDSESDTAAEAAARQAERAATRTVWIPAFSTQIARVQFRPLPIGPSVSRPALLATPADSVAAVAAAVPVEVKLTCQAAFRPGDGSKALRAAMVLLAYPHTWQQRSLPVPRLEVAKLSTHDAAFDLSQTEDGAMQALYEAICAAFVARRELRELTLSAILADLREELPLATVTLIELMVAARVAGDSSLIERHSSASAEIRNIPHSPTPSSPSISALDIALHTLTTLHLTDIPLFLRDATAIAACLPTTSLTTLVLRSTQLHAAHVLVLVQALAKNSSITSLDLSDNNLACGAGCGCFVCTTEADRTLPPARPQLAQAPPPARERESQAGGPLVEHEDVDIRVRFAPLFDFLGSDDDNCDADYQESDVLSADTGNPEDVESVSDGESNSASNESNSASNEGDSASNEGDSTSSHINADPAAEATDSDDGINSDYLSDEDDDSGDADYCPTADTRVDSDLRGIEVLVVFLGSTTVLRELYLHNCRLGAAFNALASGLAANTSLYVLDIKYNEILPDTHVALCAMAARHPTLRELSLSSIAAHAAVSSAEECWRALCDLVCQTQRLTLLDQTSFASPPAMRLDCMRAVMSALHQNRSITTWRVDFSHGRTPLDAVIALVAARPDLIFFGGRFLNFRGIDWFFVKLGVAVGKFFLPNTWERLTQPRTTNQYPPLLVKVAGIVRMAAGATNRRGAGGLHLAAQHADDDACRVLLARGHSARALDLNGNTPLHYLACRPLAATAAALDIARVLLGRAGRRRDARRCD
eukprot:m.33251 g.33251  ORF g.33251 m.33251 type:complete len:767 (-) comp5087_c0_seq1:281-2581(-)